jgi:hypothetical protein
MVKGDEEVADGDASHGGECRIANVSMIKKQMGTKKPLLKLMKMRRYPSTATTIKTMMIAMMMNLPPRQVID